LGSIVVALNQYVHTAQAVLTLLTQMVQRHPRRLSAGIAALLLGSGATAFAVAQLGPDVATLPVQQVLEDVQPLAWANSTEANSGAQPAVPALSLYRSDTTRANDTAETLLRRLGVVDAQAAAFVRSNEAARNNLLGKPGRSVSVETDANNRLTALTARWAEDDANSFQRLSIRQTASGLRASVESAPFVPSTRLAGGVIRSSLFAATDDARIPDKIATQMAEMFAGDVDFHRGLRRGDRFNVVYETLEADGEPLRAGKVLSAEFVNGNKAYQLVWFQEPGQKGQYYTLEGESQRKAFLASPMEFSRVTSGFGGRVHPIAREWRMHKGVDYAAPTGTPVRTVGDGVVTFAGMQNGYGNVIEIKHRDNKSTLFAHLSRIDVRKGQAVEQGQRVGAVGTTGFSTGPHLHFEFRVNGEHQDPLTLAKEAGTIALSAAARPAFSRVVMNTRMQLQAASTMAIASAQ
jgi:murein DD-endopeptidase MepM/ murein hydrolase activator NlpD